MGSCCGAQGAQLGALWQPRGMGWMGGREAQEGEDIGILLADSQCCTAETNTTWWRSYTPIINKLKIK